MAGVQGLEPHGVNFDHGDLGTDLGKAAPDTRPT
jgi:hypothetical protein